MKKNENICPPLHCFNVEKGKIRDVKIIEGYSNTIYSEKHRSLGFKVDLPDIKIISEVELMFYKYSSNT